MTAFLKDVIGYGLHAARPAAGSAGALYYETDTDTLLRDNGSTWDALTLGTPASGAGGLYTAHILIRDEEPQGTAGGTFTSGSWIKRTLNTKVADTGSHAVLASSQITLDAGTYRVQAHAPAYDVGRHQLRLQNVTDAATLVLGQSSYGGTLSGGTVAPARLEGRFTLAASKALELQHICEVTSATNGLGVACNFTTEVYAVIELFKE